MLRKLDCTILNQFMNTNHRMTIVSKKFEDEADQTEKWYGTQYSVKKFSALQLQVCESFGWVCVRVGWFWSQGSAQVEKVAFWYKNHYGEFFSIEVLPSFEEIDPKFNISGKGKKNMKTAILHFSHIYFFMPIKR